MKNESTVVFSMNKSHLIHKSSFHLPFFLENKVAFYCTSGGLFLFFLTFHFVFCICLRVNFCPLAKKQEILVCCDTGGKYQECDYLFRDRDWSWEAQRNVLCRLLSGLCHQPKLRETLCVCDVTSHCRKFHSKLCLLCHILGSSRILLPTTVLCKSGTNKGVCCNLPLLQVVLQTFAFLAVINIPFQSCQVLLVHCNPFSTSVNVAAIYVNFFPRCSPLFSLSIFFVVLFSL